VNQTKVTANGLNGTVSKRYKERMKIYKHELVTYSGSKIKETFANLWLKYLAPYLFLCVFK